MTYKEFFEAACALMPADQAVKVSVDTMAFRNVDGSVRTTWEIWDAGRETFYRGASPDEALAAARAARGPAATPPGMPANNDPCEVE